MVPRSPSAILFALVVTLSGSSAIASEGDSDPWFSSDKAAHFGVSAGIATAGYTLAAAAFDARGHALIVAGGATLLVGAGKEALDLAGFGTPSWKDFAWDGIGTIVGLSLAWGVDLLLRGTGAANPPLGVPRATAVPTAGVLGFAF